MLQTEEQNFDVLLTVQHLSIFILVINQLDAQNLFYNKFISGFGGLGVACWPLVPKYAGSNPTEAVGFLGRKIPQHAFLRRGSKAVGPKS